MSAPGCTGSAPIVLLDTGRTPYAGVVSMLPRSPRPITAADLVRIGDLARAYESGLGKYARRETFLEPSQAVKIGNRIHAELERLLTRSKP